MTIKKLIKRINSKVLLFLGLFFIIVSIVLMILFYNILKVDNYIYLNESQKEYDNVKLEISYLDNYFANDEDKKYYLAYDSNDNPFIVALNDETFKELKDIYIYSTSDIDSESKPESKVIYGVSLSINDKLYSYLKEFVKDESIDVGEYYLDTYYEANSNMLFWLIFYSIFILIGLLCIAIYFIKYLKIRKIIYKNKKIIEDIIDDLNNNKAIYNKICKIIISKKYILSYSNKIKVIKNKDIIWLYPLEDKEYGIITNKSIFVVDYSGKAKSIVSITTSRRKNKAYMEVYQKLMSTLTDALHGFSKANQEKVKKLIKR